MPPDIAVEVLAPEAAPVRPPEDHSDAGEAQPAAAH